jgi:hypothetical protein
MGTAVTYVLALIHGDDAISANREHTFLDTLLGMAVPVIPPVWCYHPKFGPNKVIVSLGIGELHPGPMVPPLSRCYLGKPRWDTFGCAVDSSCLFRAVL